MQRNYALEYATLLLEFALSRHGYDVLDSGQIEAMADPLQCFAMLDDFEARLGLNVAEARRVLAELHADTPAAFGGWKVGDKGTTRDGRGYEVRAIQNHGGIEALVAGLPHSHMVFLSTGRFFSDDADGYADECGHDLMAPTERRPQ